MAVVSKNKLYLHQSFLLTATLHPYLLFFYIYIYMALLNWNEKSLKPHFSIWMVTIENIGKDDISALWDHHANCKWKTINYYVHEGKCFASKIMSSLHNILHLSLSENRAFHKTLGKCFNFIFYLALWLPWLQFLGCHCLLLWSMCT